MFSLDKTELNMLTVQLQLLENKYTLNKVYEHDRQAAVGERHFILNMLKRQHSL